MRKSEREEENNIDADREGTGERRTR